MDRPRSNYAETMGQPYGGLPPPPKLWAEAKSDGKRTKVESSFRKKSLPSFAAFFSCQGTHIHAYTNTHIGNCVREGILFADCTVFKEDTPPQWPQVFDFCVWGPLKHLMLQKTFFFSRHHRPILDFHLWSSTTVKIFWKLQTTFLV